MTAEADGVTGPVGPIGPARHRRRRWLLGVGAVLVVWASLLGAWVVLASRNLGAGLDAMQAARRHVSPADLAAGTPLPDLRRARQEFSQAHRRLSGPAWWPVRVLPVLGRQARSLSALSGAARTVAGLGVEKVTEAQGLLGSPPSDDAARVSLVRQVNRIAADTEVRLANLDLGPRVALLPPLARRHNQFADELTDVRTSLRDVATVTAAVGDALAGPRRYLVFAANNAEMRAASGMFLSVGELRVGDGRLDLGDMTTVTEIPVPAGAVPLTGDLAARWGWLRPNEEWRNLMLSPRFDASAALAAQMWVASGHQPVDGVISVDVLALKALLKVSGPVTGSDRTITADNVVDELTHAQYLRFPTVQDRPERREEEGAIARAAFNALDHGKPALADLAREMTGAARGRHLVLWSARPDEQAAWRTAGIDGGLHDDSLVLSVLNRGGNKLDPFLSVTADLSLRPGPSETLGTLTVVMKNRVTADEPRLVAGPDTRSGVGAGVYLGILVVSLPGQATDGRIVGVDQLAVAGADGPTRVVGAEVKVAAGESKTVVITFRLPGGPGRLRVEPAARVPAVQWTSGQLSWSGETARRVPWSSHG